jgi:hypothetical protein
MPGDLAPGPGVPVGGVVQALLDTGHDQLVGFAVMLRSPSKDSWATVET